MVENTLNPKRYRTTQVPIPLYNGYPRTIVGYQQEEAIELLGKTPLEVALQQEYMQGGDKLIVYATTEGEEGRFGPTARVTLRRAGFDAPVAYTTDGEEFKKVDVERLIASWRPGELLTIPLEGSQDWVSNKRISQILVRTGRRDRGLFIPTEHLVRPSGIEALPIAFDATYGDAYRRRHLNQNQ